MHGTKDLEIHELHEGHAAVIILVMGADQADRELDLDLWSNGKFVSFDKLYPPTSNRQAGSEEVLLSKMVNIFYQNGYQFCVVAYQ